MRWLVVFTILALAGCEAGRSDMVSRHQAVNNFHLALGRIMPVAQAFCTQRAVPNCDFAIVVDDTPGLAPNAAQSVAADGRPVLTFTTAMIEDARNLDEIALIIAHEAAHHIDGHLGRLNMQVAALLAQAGEDEGHAGQGHPPHDRWSDVYAKRRAFELAADRLGTQIIAAAGFDPLRGAQIFLRFSQPAQHDFGAYPLNEDRLSAVRQAL